MTSFVIFFIFFFSYSLSQKSNRFRGRFFLFLSFFPLCFLLFFCPLDRFPFRFNFLIFRFNSFVCRLVRKKKERNKIPVRVYFFPVFFFFSLFLCFLFSLNHDRFFQRVCVKKKFRLEQSNDRFSADLIDKQNRRYSMPSFYFFSSAFALHNKYQLYT